MDSEGCAHAVGGQKHHGVVFLVRGLSAKSEATERVGIAGAMRFLQCIHPPPPTKKELSSTKSSFFVYPSRRLGISSPREVRCISSAPSGLYLITRQRASYLRLDDIQCFALMIYRNKLRMIYKAYALIYLRKCDIINSPINKNLTR